MDTCSPTDIPTISKTILPFSPPITPDPISNLKSSTSHPKLTINTDPSALAPPDRPRLGTAPAPWDRRLSQRQKQLDYGYNTVGYQNYIQKVPKTQRKRGDPQTPDKHQTCSTRSWMGQIKRWRRKLHLWDNPVDVLETDDLSISEKSCSDAKSCVSYSSIDSDRAMKAASEWLEQVSDSDSSMSVGHISSDDLQIADEDIYRFSSLSHYEQEYTNHFR